MLPRICCREFNRTLRLNIRITVLLASLLILLVYYTSSMFRTDYMKSMDFYKKSRELYIEKCERDIHLRKLDLHEYNDPRQTCQIPIYHPFEKDVLGYFQNPRPISCRSRGPILTFIDNDGFLRFNETALTEAGYSRISLKCYYQEIYRIRGNDRKVVFGEEKAMTGEEKPATDFTYVSCKRYFWLPSIYSMYHAFAQRRTEIRKFQDDAEVGAAVIGIDSVSRLNFMRQLPYSYRYITKEMKGVVLKGFNKVGENTFPNVIAMLTGNVPLTKWPKSTFDDWPFIWNMLRKDGVATFYGEDYTKIMTFAWWGEGFELDPTTHYFRPYWLAAESSSLAAWSSPMCLSGLPKHRIYLDYLKSFFMSYRQSPVFMFSLENEPSHDYLNTVGVMDHDLRQFLMSGHENALFNRTILFVLSDHGHRFDDFRRTKQGKIEDRMPMVSVILPKWYAEKYPHILSNLEVNSRRLTSSFDLYSTFVDIFLRDSAGNGRKSRIPRDEFPVPIRGVSLFQEIPLNRTCEEAGVPEMYCICVKEAKQIEIDGSITLASAQVIQDYINNEVLEAWSQTWNDTLKNHFGSGKESGEKLKDIDFNSIKKCAKLSVDVGHSELVMKSDGGHLVHLTFKTYPSEGLFEGRVLWPRGFERGSGRIHEDIIRINRYGDQADCLERTLMNHLPLIRSVCYCVDPR